MRARRPSAGAASSSGSAVAPSIQTSPPSKCSCFQIGAICLIRSMANRQAANASARCAEAAAITTLASPISTRPIRWWMASAIAGQRSRGFVADLREGLQRQRLVRLVVEPEHPPAGVVIANEADERRDRPASVGRPRSPRRRSTSSGSEVTRNARHRDPIERVIRILSIPRARSGSAARARAPMPGRVPDGAVEVFARALDRLAIRSPSARFAAIADDRVQPVPCVCGVSIRGRRISNALAAVQTTSIDSGPSRWPPLTQYDARPHARGSARRPARMSSSDADGHPGQHLRFRHVRRDHVRARQQFRSHRRDRVVLEQPSPPLAIITGSTTTCGSSSSSIAAPTASTIAAFASMPIFTASAPMSPTTASICAVTRSAGSACQRDDPERVLRRHRRDRAGAVDAMRGERLAGRPGCRRHRPNRCPQLS